MPLHGRACVADPWGRIVAQCGPEGDDLAVADVDAAALARTRAKLPLAEAARSLVRARRRGLLSLDDYV